jgi:DNA-binding transcriptional MocR family regulator
MPENNKKALVNLAHQYKLAVIEDDIYGDLSFSGERPPSLHSFAENDSDTVIYCSSFSKTISHGLRIGWMILPEKLHQRAEYLKYVINLAAPTLPQLALADFLAQSSYDRHLKFIQAQYALQVSSFTQAISNHFPEGTRVSHPQGGFVIWVELEKKVDSLKLSHLMLSKKISIAPGQIFSASQKYHHCIRLNCAQPWSSMIEKSLIILGREL